MKRRRKYLKDRLSLLVILLAALTAVIWSAYLYTSVKGGRSPVPAALMGGAFAACMAVLFFRVFLPYREMEHNIDLFLSGYTAEGLLNSDVALSEKEEQLFLRVQKALSSDDVLKMNKRQAQYLALQNQINPHFLYNTLESIRSEAMEAGMTNVMNMTEALADFFRYTISKVENMVTLEEELKNVETYFYIQQYRFEDKLKLEIVYEDERELLDKALIPKLTLQPVVENSIIHGIERKMGTGTVRIFLSCTSNRILIKVSDDGVGMDAETLLNLCRSLDRPLLESDQYDENRKGIALVNVNNRIHLLFGEEYGLVVQSIEGLGTDVIIGLPYLISTRQLKERENR